MCNTFSIDELLSKYEDKASKAHYLQKQVLKLKDF